MPLETLLAMYGYSDENQPDANIDVPLDEIRPEPLPPLDDVEDHPPVPLPIEAGHTLLDGHQADATPSPLDEGNLAPPSEESAPPVPMSHRNNNYFPENQRITRGCKCTVHYCDTEGWACVRSFSSCIVRRVITLLVSIGKAALTLTHISAYSTHKNLAVHKIMEAMRTVYAKKKQDSVSTRLKQNMTETITEHNMLVCERQACIVCEEHISLNLKGAFEMRHSFLYFLLVHISKFLCAKFSPACIRCMHLLKS